MMFKVPTLNKFYESLYLKVLINIVIGHSKLTVYVEMLNGSGVESSSKEIFDAPYPTTAMYEYIHSFTKESPYFYISILDSSLSQGAIPTCNKQDMTSFYDLSTSEYKCYDEKWIYYTSTSDIYEIQRAYEKIGVDYIFSPFVVLANFFDDKINTYLAMFILVEDDSLSFSVFDNSKLLYAEHLDMNIEIESEELLLDVGLDDEIDLDEETSIDLDDIDALDDIDELDDFGDIADLDSIEEINEFSETQDVEEELLEEAENESTEDNSSGFNEDYQRFSLIQSSVNRYYHNDKFDNKFLENVYIADSIGVSGDLKKYLEEEMFLNVYIRHVELATEVCEITKMELL